MTNDLGRNFWLGFRVHILVAVVGEYDVWSSEAARQV